MVVGLALLEMIILVRVTLMLTEEAVVEGVNVQYFCVFCDYICAFVINEPFLLLIQRVVLICLLAHLMVRDLDYTQLATRYLGDHSHPFLVVLLLSHTRFQLVDLLVLFLMLPHLETTVLELVVEVQLGATFRTNKPPRIMLEQLALV